MIMLTSTKIGTMFYYIANTFIDGAHRIASSLPKKLLYLFLALLAPTFQLLSVSKPLLFSLLPYFVFIDIALALMMVFLFSDWKRISILYSFSTINFYNSAGACPWLVCRSSAGGVITYTFQCKGMPLAYWHEHQEDLEAAFDCHILSINYADGSDNLFELKFVPAKGALPTNVPAPNFSLEDFVIKLGISFAGEYCINFNHLVHMLITGATGGGKTILVRWIIYQLVNKFSIVYLIDLKGFVDYQDLREDCRCLDTNEKILAALKSVVENIAHRMELCIQAGVSNIADYNKLPGVEQEFPIFVIIDEANCLLDPTGKGKAGKDFIQEVIEYLLTITRLGRAAHVHLICVCQRSDVGSIPGALKANMEIRITSHCADKESSITILGNGDAANLPKIPGRFLSSDGTEFQAYKFSCPPGENS
ncbi:FtsK/SpoIIIE domain-containing protein [Gemmiger sp.]|uniref:FtsK/SpoIIIE domain-containing protein n=1 Tax=Gemmiger sp. TaxID=2049027 RepID=UPI003FD89CA5